MTPVRFDVARRSLLLLLGVTLVAAPAAAQRPASRAVARPAFKGIFEPVPFPGDVTLNDVFFATPEVGWATGGNGIQNGVIIATTDAGATWTVQLGDPESSEGTYSQLRFVDGRIGFAAQHATSGDHRLVRTLDGEHWAMVGTVPEHRTDFAFVSATVGVTAYSGKILRTQDAGRTWAEVFECRLRVQIEGLTREVKCDLDNLHFPTRRVGYGIGYASGLPGVFIAKTEDAGAHWSAWLAIPEESGREADLFFVDERQGSACLYGGKLVRTEDGGRTWNPVPGPACNGKPAVRFADPEVGWNVVYHAFGFTVNGGRSWSGRTIEFPALVTAFSLPRRDRGYVVGEHGMVYRYRVVPAAEATPPGVFAAPAMPGITTVLDERVSELEQTIAQLEAAVAAAPDSAAGAVASPATPRSDAAEPDAAPADAAPADAAPADAADSTQTSIPEPLPDVDPGADQVELPSGALPDASTFTESCCGKPQGRLKLLLSAIVGALPDLLERHRNTNSLGGTLLMLVELPLKVTGLRNALAAFWAAPDKASAQLAIGDLTAAVGELKASTAMVFQRDPVALPVFEEAPPAGESEVRDAAATAAADSTVADSVAAEELPAKAAGAVKKKFGGLIKKKIRVP